MPRTIQQSVVFNVPAERLFDIYMDARKHAAAIGSTVSVNRKPGSRFAAFDGSIVGRTLAVVPGRRLVQTWRARGWPAADLDSILILTFTDDPLGGRVDLVHAGVPEHAYADVKAGWTAYYWRPWKAYLRKAKGRT